MDDAKLWALLERLVEMSDDPSALLEELRGERELLLSDRFLAFLEDAATELDAAGDDAAVETLAELYRLLEMCREAGIELAVEAAFLEPPEEELVQEFAASYRRAEQLEARFEANDDPAALDAAIELATELIEHPVAAAWPDVRLGTLAGLASLRGRRYRQRSQSADLAATLELVERVVAVTPPGSRVRAMAHMIVSEARRTRYAVSRSPDDLDRAVGSAQAAVAETPATSPERPRYASEFGVACLFRYEATGDAGDLQRAVAVLEEAARQAQDVLADDHADRPLCLAALAAGLWARYRHTGDLTDLDDAAVAA